MLGQDRHDCGQTERRAFTDLTRKVCLHEASLYLTPYHRYGLKKETTVMVGDRLSTDITFGKHGGYATLLVLTGISTLDDITRENPSPPVVPDYYTDCFGDLLLE